jgi:hypothetical protein
MIKGNLKTKGLRKIFTPMNLLLSKETISHKETHKERNQQNHPQHICHLCPTCNIYYTKLEPARMW